MDSKEYIELKKEIEGLSESVKGQGTSVSNRVNSGTITNIITGTTFIADGDVIIDSIF